MLQQQGLSRLVLRFRWAVIAAWAAAAATLGALAPSLRDVGTADPRRFLPGDAPSVRAQELLRRGWPDQALQEGGVVVLERRGGLRPTDLAYLQELETWVRQHVPQAGAVRSPTSDPRAAAWLRSQDGQAVLMLIGFRTPPFSSPTNQAVDRIRTHLRTTAPRGAQAHLTGPAAIAADQATSIRRSFDRTAVGTVVLILLILLSVYRSPVAATVPLVTIGVAFWVARAVVALLARAGLQVSSQVDTFMVVMVFGAGTDYCLFLVSRYREELRAGAPAALQRTLAAVGRVVLASGATVVLAFLSQLTARFGIYRTMGPAIGVAVAVTVAAALTLTPAIAAVLGRRAFWPARPEDRHQLRDLRWARIARVVTGKPRPILIAGTLLLALPALGGMKLRTSFDLLEELPAGAEARRGFAVLAAHYPKGTISPTFVLLHREAGFGDEASFGLMQRLTERLARIPGVAEARSAPLPAGRPITFDLLGRARALGLDPSAMAADPRTLDEIASRVSSREGLILTPGLLRDAPGLREVAGFFLSADGRTARIMVTLDADPFSTRAIARLEAVREAALREARASGAQVLLGGATAFYADMRRIANEDFRWTAAQVVLIVLAVFGLLLRSVVAPLYLLATVLLSFAATIGATVAVFQGALGQDGITLWVPPFLFVMLVALGADYNIFLMSRVNEEYERTGDAATAVGAGVELTGRVITSAGLILAGTFAMLVAAPMRNLVQVGFAITLGILLDTFVLRTLVVPSITVLLGPLAWWPRTLPVGAEHVPRVVEVAGGRR